MSFLTLYINNKALLQSFLKKGVYVFTTRSLLTFDHGLRKYYSNRTCLFCTKSLLLRYNFALRHFYQKVIDKRSYLCTKISFALVASFEQFFINALVVTFYEVNYSMKFNFERMTVFTGVTFTKSAVFPPLFFFIYNIQNRRSY